MRARLALSGKLAQSPVRVVYVINRGDTNGNSVGRSRDESGRATAIRKDRPAGPAVLTHCSYFPKAMTILARSEIT